MDHASPELAARLDALKAAGTIAGWQDANGPNYGLSRDPLPAKIFPASFGPAFSYYDEAELRTAVQALELFGPIEQVPRRVR